MTSKTNPAVCVSIVIPCLNEVTTLEACILRAQEAIALMALPGEVVVADNGSQDGSQQLAHTLGAVVVNVPIKGYGAALIGGILNAQGEYIVMGDADCSYDFVEAVPMVAHLRNGIDLCMGSRLRGYIEPGAMPYKNRYLGTPVLTFILNCLYGAHFSDVNCGMRAFSKKAFLTLQMESFGMEFASEMLIKAQILELNITEVPISLFKDKRNRKPHLRPWIDGWRHLKYIILFAPKFLFWVPGGVSLACGIFLALLLDSASGGQFVYIRHFRFNDHFMIVAAFLCLIGYEIILTGLLADFYTASHRLKSRSVMMDTLSKHASIELLLFFYSDSFSLRRVAGRHCH